MNSTSYRIPEIDAENWRHTFARMGIFSLLLLVLTALLRYSASGRQIAPPQILDSIRNWALIFLAAALPLYAWNLRMAHGAHRRRVDLRGTALLFAITLGALCAILLLRAALLNVGLGGHSTVLLRCIQMLDLAAALILPMVSGFTLVMLPYISPRGMRRAAKLLAGGCLLALSLIAVATYVSAVYAAPQGTTNPIDRPQPQDRSFA